MYCIEDLRLPMPSHLAAVSSSSSIVSLWHHRLGHLSFSRLQTLISNGSLGCVPQLHHVDCFDCHLSKQTTLPFNVSLHSSANAFDLIHSDVWTLPITSLSGSKYYVLFVDDHTRYTWVYIIRAMSDVLKVYTEFTTMIHTHFSKHIKVFRSDSGGEYRSASFIQLLKSHGTLPQLSCPDTPQQNGVAE